MERDEAGIFAVSACSLLFQLDGIETIFFSDRLFGENSLPLPNAGLERMSQFGPIVLQKASLQNPLHNSGEIQLKNE